jgi:predicted ester cyclase
VLPRTFNPDRIMSTTVAVDPTFARAWLDRFVAAWNSHDPEQLISLSTEDITWIDPLIHPSGELQGHAELRKWLTSAWRAIPDLTFRLEGEPLISLDQTRVGAYWIGTGTMTGPLDPPGFAPTGRPLLQTGFDLHTFRGDRVSHVLTVTDVNAVARQIGAAPAPGTAGEKLGVMFQRVAARLMR